MTLAYRKRSRNGADLLSLGADFYKQTNLPLFWDDDMPKSSTHREQHPLPRSHDTSIASQNLDADLSNLSAHVLHKYPEPVEMTRQGCAKDSTYGDEGAWTKSGHIVVRNG
jgi:hypothetical protein